MQTIRFERDNAVGRIILANPPFNRLDLRFSECLRQAVHDASESDVRVVLIKAEGPHFSFGGEVREWPGKDINWFRTFVAEVNLSYRAIEALRVPTIAAVQGVAFGGGFELALNCDFIVAAANAVFRCVEVTTGMLPIAGALQRLAERIGRGRASRFAMLGRADLRSARGPTWHSLPRRSRSQSRTNSRDAGKETGGGPDQVLRGDPHAFEGLVGGRSACCRCRDARHRDGSVQHRRLHSRLSQYSQGVRSRH